MNNKQNVEKRAETRTSFPTEVWKLSYWKINSFAINLRQTIKKQKKPLDLVYVIGSLPFIVGFFDFIFTKYSDKPLRYFFEKNLPGLNLPAENLQWETFQYIKSKELNLGFNSKASTSLNPTGLKSCELRSTGESVQRGFTSDYQSGSSLFSKAIKTNTKFIKKILFYDNSISFEITPSWKSKQKKFYIGNFLVNNDTDFSPKGQAPSALATESSIPRTNVTAAKLPGGLKSRWQKIPSQKILDFLHLTEQNRSFAKDENFIRTFYSSLDELPTKLDSINLFIEPDQSVNPFTFIPSWDVYPISWKKTLNATESMPKGFNRNLHKVHGDLKKSNIILKGHTKKFFFQNTKKNLNNLVLLNNTTSQNLVDKVLDENQQNSRPLVRDPQGKDRENFFTDQEFLQKYFRNFFLNTGLLPINLFSEEIKSTKPFSITNLFEQDGIKDSLQIFKKKINVKKKFKSFDLEQTFTEIIPSELLSILDEFWLPNQQNLVSLRKNSGYLYPDTNKDELKKHFLQYFSQQFFFQKSFFLKTQVPDTYLAGFNFEPTFLDIRKPVEKKMSFNFHPWSENLLEDRTLQKKYAYGFYKHETSIYGHNLTSKFSTPFQDLWEPLTLKSWLIITKLSFAFVALKILKNIYTNYKQELSLFAEVLAALGIIDEATKQELFADETERGFRIIKKSKKKFFDIAGIEFILPELGEIVWFLRNSGRSFQIANLIPKGLLLVGPPGTGKTLLVQALAGEAQVPVLVLSGSSLKDPEKPRSGPLKLKNLFQEARKNAPCIVFIDEIDTLGQKREQVMTNPMGADQILESLSNLQTKKDNYFQSEFIPKPKNNFQQPESINETGFFLEKIRSQNQSKHEQLALLMQFLVEMDGLQLRTKIIVIGATNRQDVLDPALLRPGRFDKVLELGLPGKQKRIDILKLYSQPLGYDLTIDWGYFAERTVGLSAADLSAIMNESAMNAIILKTVHNLKTIEQGIDRITSDISYKPTSITQIKKNTDPFILARLSYYQAGKMLIHYLLPRHPNTVVVHLWPRIKNTRYLHITKSLQKEISQFSRRSDLETRIMGFYAGKAAELLILGQTSAKTIKTPEASPLWMSDLGYDDLSFANYLAYIMIDKWYFYSKKVALRKTLQLTQNTNLEEISNSDKIEHFKHVSEQIENPLLSKPRFDNSDTPLSDSRVVSDFDESKNQRWFGRPWWQFQIAQELRLLDPTYSEWYRLYLPNPEERELNEEWIPPDEFYHNNSSLKNLLPRKTSPSVTLNDFYELDRDYIFHGLILNCFNKAFDILDNHRELLDSLAEHLRHHEVLRQNELHLIFNRFNSVSSSLGVTEGGASLSSTESLSKEETSVNSKENFSQSQPESSQKNSSEGLRPNGINANAYAQSPWVFDPQGKDSELLDLKTQGFFEASAYTEGVRVQVGEIKSTQNSWGKNSRRKVGRFIDFEKLA